MLNRVEDLPAIWASRYPHLVHLLVWEPCVMNQTYMRNQFIYLRVEVELPNECKTVRYENCMSFGFTIIDILW